MEEDAEDEAVEDADGMDGEAVDVAKDEEVGAKDEEVAVDVKAKLAKTGFLKTTF